MINSALSWQFELISRFGLSVLKHWTLRAKVTDETLTSAVPGGHYITPVRRCAMPNIRERSSESGQRVPHRND